MRSEIVAAVAAGLQNQVGRIGAGLDRAERLVDLVRDRRRQLAGHRQPRRVRELGALLLHRQLGRAAAAALEEQRGDQRGLEQDDGDGDDRHVPVRLPERRLAEMHDGVGRNPVLVDAPPPDLPPVDVQRRRHDLRQAQRGGRGAGEQAR